MGIISKISKNYLTKLGDTIANGQHSVAKISSSQIEELNKKRKKYLGEIDNKKNAQYSKELGAIALEVYQTYLKQLDEVYCPVDNCIYEGKDTDRITFFNITKWVYDPEEKNLDKLVNVYQMLSDDVYNIALIYHRTNEETKVYLAIVNAYADSDRQKLRKVSQGVFNAITGNFPGVEIKVGKDGCCTDYGIPDCLKAEYVDDKYSIASISNIASEKSEDFVSQSMEKLLDGNIPEKGKSYTLILLATPASDKEEKKERLYELYTEISHLAGFQESYSVNESINEGASANIAVNAGIAKTDGVSVGAGVEGFVSVGGHKAVTVNMGAQFARSANESRSVGNSQGISRNHVNYAVKYMLEYLEAQIKRIDESSALGSWNFSAYVISDQVGMARNVAYMYLALTQGNISHYVDASVNIWEQNDEVSVLFNSLRNLRHPIFKIREEKINENPEWLMYPLMVDATVSVSGKELAKALNFPRKSVSGLPVLECIAFGREVQKYDSYDNTNEADIGTIYHMRKKEEKTVHLDYKKSLTSHVFVTGSTGTGKSNTIYQLIDKRPENVKVLVIEPAKGEYKTVFGGCFDHVFGTGMDTPEILKLNPFYFPDRIHVLEHIDRFVEILNACWPMYAAMPAVLKDAIEQTYSNCGWNLESSKCCPKRYPTFNDLFKSISYVIENSDYSNDTKSDYAGALITRIKSLTNGLNKRMLSSVDCIDDKELFEKNVIIDISRIGSMETKSLIMGILIMKLQEFRISQGKVNNELCHMTIIEEAHNLLRRTSYGQAQDSANLMGKSVEMLTNAIAEMRTYGEGFIVADQAPGLLDEAVIRNTNTKIILRLPDGDDREIVGKSAALNDSQINELAKLPKGVAAVYQNDWVEAVLCKFELFNDKKPIPVDLSKKEESSQYKLLKMAFGNSAKEKLDGSTIDSLEKWVISLNLKQFTKNILAKIIKNEPLDESEKERLAYNLFEGKKIAGELKNGIVIEKAIENVDKKIEVALEKNDSELAERIRQHIIQYICDRYSGGEFETRYRNYGLKRG